MFPKNKMLIFSHFPEIRRKDSDSRQSFTQAAGQLQGVHDNAVVNLTNEIVQLKKKKRMLEDKLGSANAKVVELNAQGKYTLLENCPAWMFFIIIPLVQLNNSFNSPSQTSQSQQSRNEETSSRTEGGHKISC
jgi:hypothetical protein